MYYTWMSGGQPHVIALPKQERGETDGDYARRLAALIANALQEFPPDP